MKAWDKFKDNCMHFKSTETGMITQNKFKDRR